MKIYTEDRLVPYKTTKIPPLTTKAEIDGLLARWGIRKTMWDWNPEMNVVTLVFELPQEYSNPSGTAVKIEPPRIWTKGHRNRKEEINWQVSMRVLFWYLKSSLENAYLMQFDKTTAFLPHIMSSTGQLLKDIVIPRLSQVSELESLPSPTEERKQLDKIISVSKEEQQG